MYLNCAHLGHRPVLIVVHGAGQDGRVTLPAPPGVTGYELLWDSAWERPAVEGVPLDRVGMDSRSVAARAATIQLYLADDAT